MDRLANWIEIPARDIKRATAFYGIVLKVDFREMEMGANRYALFGIADSNFGGALVVGKGYVPSEQGAVVYLSGGADLSAALGRVEKAGGKVLLGKTFLSEQAGHIAYFRDTEGNKIGLHSMG
jgi:uncharacterized protein